MMGGILLALAFQASSFLPEHEVQPTDDVYPQPAYFLPLAQKGGFVGYVQCLGDYGEHLVKSTSIPVEQVIAKTLKGCDILKDPAIDRMSDSSVFRRALEEESGRSLEDRDLEPVFRKVLAAMAKRWSDEFSVNAAEYRKSSAYDPEAYRTSYRAELPALKDAGQ